MTDVTYLTVAHVIGLYEIVMLESEQPLAALVREDALQRAVHHPRNLAYYENAGLAEQAVDLALEIALAHAWVDGNKRLSVRCFEIFLELNSVTIPDDGYQWFGDAFIELVGALPEDRVPLSTAMVSRVESWIG